MTAPNRKTWTAAVFGSVRDDAHLHDQLDRATDTLVKLVRA